MDSGTRNVLGIFAKAPVSGCVKTRLAAAVGADTAAAWYARFLRAVFYRTQAAWPDAERILFFDPPDSGAMFDPFPYAPDHRVPQAGPDLGARMAAAFRYTFERGTARTLLIGTDAPSLPMAYLGEAWRALANRDVVLGPATDGGYYLVGLRESRPTLFEDVAWSTDTVLKTTLRHADSQGLSVHLLPEWFDVDTVEDLAALGSDWESEA